MALDETGTPRICQVNLVPSVWKLPMNSISVGRTALSHGQARMKYLSVVFSWPKAERLRV